jgi:hypothetical protein
VVQYGIIDRADWAKKSLFIQISQIRSQQSPHVVVVKFRHVPVMAMNDLFRWDEWSFIA